MEKILNNSAKQHNLVLLNEIIVIIYSAMTLGTMFWLQEKRPKQMFR